jgi:2-polyprenyl-3-methyl-5-hydroxy-6-metoxy-1,4-benzoquinol methylase
VAQKELAKVVANVMVTKGKAFVTMLARTATGNATCAPVREVNPNVADLAAALTGVFQAGNLSCETPGAEEPGSKYDPRLTAAGFRSWEELARQGAFYLIYRDEPSIHLDVSQHFQTRRRRGEKAYVLMDKAKSLTLPSETPLADIARLVMEDAKRRPEVWRTQPATGEVEPSNPAEKVRAWPNLAYRGMMAAMWVEDRLSSPRRLLAQMPLQPGLTVVDYACGPGRYTIHVAEAVGPQGRVYAVDSQPLALEMVERKAAQEHVTNIQTVLVDSFDTGLPGGVADLALLIDAVTPITNRAPLLREIHRLLKPEGQLFMDASHMSPARAEGIVEDTGLFELLKMDGRVMLWRRAEGAKS